MPKLTGLGDMKGRRLRFHAYFRGSIAAPSEFLNLEFGGRPCSLLVAAWPPCARAAGQLALLFYLRTGAASQELPLTRLPLLVCLGAEGAGSRRH